MLRGIFAQVATVAKELKRVVTVVVDIWASATPCCQKREWLLLSSLLRVAFKEHEKNQGGEAAG